MPRVKRSDLRETVFAFDGWHCVWPDCSEPAVELAHFHSIGMGGRSSADRVENTGAMCRDHARISDGLHASGGAEQYEDAHRRLAVATGATFEQVRADGLSVAWWRAEALTAWAAIRRAG